jgi:hypothetical protein
MSKRNAAQEDKNWSRLHLKAQDLKYAISHNEGVCKLVGTLEAKCGVTVPAGHLYFNFSRNLKIKYHDITELDICSGSAGSAESWTHYYFNSKIDCFNEEWIKSHTEQVNKTPMEIAKMAKRLNKKMKAQLSVVQYMLRPYDSAWEFFKMKAGWLSFNTRDSKKMFNTKNKEDFYKLCRELAKKNNESFGDHMIDELWGIATRKDPRI